MGIAVLGRVSIDGRAPALGRRDRVVLAALTVHPGEGVTTDGLADLLWGEDPPASAAKIVQGCIVRLRKLLGSHAIETTPDGYRLTVPMDQIDAQRFERAVERARSLIAADDPERAGHVLAEALSLWRGAPLVELDTWDRARIEAARLAELRLAAEELHVETALRSGHHEEVVARASALVGEAPLRERRWVLLATAQYHSGRQSEALATLRRLRTVLQEELGLEPGPEIAELEAAILRQDPTLAPATALPEPSAECPYRGLLPYDVADAETFFGREADIEACLRRLAATSVLAVVGPSGCGKSSLIRAGVAAALRRDGVSVVILTPGAHPMSALTAMSGAAPASLLVVDQCEEVFSLCSDPSEREQFLGALTSHAESARLVLSFRADRLADISVFPAFARLMEQGMFLLGALDEDGLRMAIEEPACRASLVVEPGLVDLLVSEVAGHPGALPLVSHALSQTWHRREGRTMTVAAYRDSGGIRGAVAQSAEEIYTGLEPEQQALLRDLLLRLVSPGPAGEPVRSRLPRRLVAAGPRHDQMIDLLIRSRLVMSDASVVEIAHEALAAAWPRLRGWLDDDVDGQRVLHHLAMAADAWDSLGRPDSELYRGVRLAAAREWRVRAPVTLSSSEQAFLDASERLASTELRSAQDQSRRQHRANRRLRGLLGVAAALLIAALVAGLLALDQADEARTSRGAALRAATAEEARSVGSRALVSPDVAQSMLLAVEGVRIEDSPQTQANLLAVLAKRPQLISSLQGTGDDYLGLDVSPDGRTAVVLDRHYDVRTYDLDSGAPGPTFRPHPSHAAFLQDGRVEFHPSGQFVAVTAAPLEESPARLLDARTMQPLRGRLPTRLPATTLTYDLGFSADGRFLAASVDVLAGGPEWEATQTRALVWDVSEPSRPVLVLTRRLPLALPGEVPGVSLSPDGSVLYTGRRTFPVGPGTALPPAGTRPREGMLVRTSPDGTVLAVSTADEHSVRLLDSRTGRSLHVLTGHADDPAAVAFSPDGRRMATLSYDRTVIVWDVSSGVALEHLDLSEPATAVAFAPDGLTLYTAGPDRAIRAWDLEGSRRYVSRLRSPTTFSYGLMLPAPGGDFIAIDSGDGLTIRNVAAGTVTDSRNLGSGFRWNGGAWSPDARRFATVSGGVVKVWDPLTGAMLRSGNPSGVGKRVSSLGYTPDGSRLVLGEQSGRRVTMLDADNLTAIGRPVVLEAPVCGLATASGTTAVVLTGGPSSSDRLYRRSGGWALVDLSAGRVVRSGSLGIPDGVWVAASPRGRYAAVVGARGEVVLIDTTTGALVRPPVVAHDDIGNTIAYSADGTRVVSAGFDGSISLVDGRTGDLLGTVVLPERTLASASFMHDDKTVLVASYAQSIYRWDTRPDRARDFACEIAGRNLTHAEWRDNFTTRPYETTCP